MLMYRIGRTNRSSIKQLKLFFEQQTFGPNYFRRDGPADISILGTRANDIRSAHPVPAGANDQHGNFVLASPPLVNFVSDTRPMMK